MYSWSSEIAVRPDSPVMVWGKVIGFLLQLGLGTFLILTSSSLVTLLQRRWNRTRPVAADARCPHCGFWIVLSDYEPWAAGYRCDNCKGEIPHEVILAARGSGVAE